MKEYNVLDRLTAEYNAMSKANRKIANFIFRNKDEIQYMSITKLAEGSDVAVATVTRFCRDLGFPSFHAFRLEMAKAQNAHTLALEAASPGTGGKEADGLSEEDGSFEGYIRKIYTVHADAIWKTMKMLHEEEVLRAAVLLNEADRVFLIGRGGGYVAAKAATYRFQSISSKFVCIEDIYAEAIYATLGGPGDVLLTFSYTGKDRSGVTFLRMARERGMKIVLVTHFINSPEAALADAVLLCGRIEDPEQALEMSVKTSQMFVIDVLCAQYRELGGEEAVRNQRKVTETLRKQLL